MFLMQKWLIVTLTVIAFSFFFTMAIAQDTIVTRNQVIIPARVIEIDEISVKYKKPSNPTGPDYLISKKKLDRIIYANGTVEQFNKPLPVKTMQKDYYGWKEGHTTIGLAVTDLIFGVGTIHFERTFLRDHLAMRVPFSVGFNSFSNDTFLMSTQNGFFNSAYTKFGFYNKNKIFSIGLDVLAFPFERRKANYFVGMSFEYGEFNYFSTYIVNYVNSAYAYAKDRSSFFGVLIKNGIEIQPSKHLIVSGNVALGASRISLYAHHGSTPASLSDELFSRAFQANICVGYRF